MADDDDDKTTAPSTSKHIKVAASTLIDLKAELAKKKEQFQREKLSNVPRVRAPTQFKRNAGVEERAKRDIDTEVDADELELSRKALERKTKIYEKLSDNSRALDDKPEDETPFLVDFDQKIVNEIIQKREEAAQEEEKKESDSDSLDEFDDKDDGDWVEFTDSLGRSRVCRREDLDHFKRMDSKLQEKPKPVESAIPAKKPTVTGTIKIQDSHHEKLKKKWAEDEELMKHAANVHYENVRYDEIRTHGIGFYQFSTDETTRLEQRRMLDDLRERTIAQRAKSQALRLKRKQLMKERLKRVRRRKRIRQGLDPDLTDEEQSDSHSDEDPLALTEKEKIRLKSISEKADEKTAAPSVREWDVGKLSQGLEQKWAEKKEILRGERVDEFAPPSFY